MSYTVNCSILFTELPLLDRPAAAKAAGFDAVEFWWPFDAAVPAEAEVEAFASAIEAAGVQLTGLNFFAGDMRAGDRGLVSWVGREDEFRANVEVVVALGERLGCRAFNALYGNRIAGVDPTVQDALAVKNLAFAAQAVDRIGGIVLLEPVSGVAAYPLKTAADALAVIDRVRAERDAANVRLLADFYHLAVNVDDVASVIAEHAADFGHVQIADAPGRGEPGTGGLPISAWISAARTNGYRGPIGLEYTATQTDPFAWLSAPSTTRVAFIGLGIMGLPMAKNLLKAGFDVTGYNRSVPPIDALVAAGGHAATGIADAVTDADVIITMLPDSPDVERVVGGENGVIANARLGALWIDNSSIRPDVARQLAKQAIAAGLGSVDAPVSGGEQGAIDAVLSIMVGGSEVDFARSASVLNALGRTIVHVGPAGSGQTVKAANQLIVAVNIQALAEAIVFLEASGVDMDAALTVLGGGLAGSKVLEQKGRRMLDREFAPGFRLALHHKDLGIAAAAARQAGVAIPLGAAVAQLVGAAVARGDGGLDHSALFALTAALAGRSSLTTSEETS